MVGVTLALNCQPGEEESNPLTADTEGMGNAGGCGGGNKGGCLERCGSKGEYERI
jgi:hypothetical protein